MPARPKRFTLSSKHATKQADGSFHYDALATGSLVLALLKITGTTSMNELITRLREGDEAVQKKFATIVLTEEQLAGIELHKEAVDLIRSGPSVTVAVCPTCGAISAFGAGSPTSCTLTLSCPGKPEKAVAATKAAYTEPV